MWWPNRWVGPVATYAGGFGDGQAKQRRVGGGLQAGLEAQRVPGLQVMVEVEIDGRTFWVRPVSPDVLQAGNVVATALAESLDKPFPWAVGFFFSGNLRVRWLR